MKKAVQLQIRKELNGHQQKQIIKLKGRLISKGYTEIIYIQDKDDQYHINSFDIPLEIRGTVQDFINLFIIQNDLIDVVLVK